jgi:ethanolamine utilization microcompartment shell protein EutL
MAAEAARHMAAEAARHMAAEAARHMAAEAVGVLMAAEAARHMVVEVAVHTAIVKISAFHKGPPLTNEAGLLLSSSPKPIQKPVHNSLFVRVFNE